MGNTSNQPMYFTRLELENVKCFGENRQLDLINTDGTIAPWTLILGNNGLGKTTLLKCLAWMTTVEETDAKRKEKAKIPEETIAVKAALDGLDDDTEYEHLARIGNEVTTVIKAQLSIGCPLKEVPNVDQLIEYSITIKTKDGKLTDIVPTLVAVNEFNTPLIYAYSASRHMEQKNIDRSELTDPISNLFSISGEMLDAVEQLLRQDHAALRDPSGKENELLATVKSILVALLPGIDNVDNIIIDAKNRQVLIRTKDGDVPLNDLSLGYKTMFAWIVDLALKMLAQNPDSPKPLEEPAIVIVDEVDLHLHPQWQRIIQQKLRFHFPHTQFICTAHSPFMAQSAENENLCVVERDSNDSVKIENAPHRVKGWRIGQIVTSDLFGVPSDRGILEERMIGRRQELLDKDTPTAEETNELKMLDERIASLPDVDTETTDLINQLRSAAKILKERGLIND